MNPTISVPIVNLSQMDNQEYYAINKECLNILLEMKKQTK